MMILRPLLIYDKLDIIEVAQKIRTFDISQIQVPDSCTVFAPASPSTHASLPMVKEDESKLDLHALLAECIGQTTILSTLNYASHPFVELRDVPIVL